MYSRVFQNDQRANQWPRNGYRRASRGRKASCRKGEMGATVVMPTSNTYHDLRVKFHSVSGGSALAQSMKYAEAWLYGSLSLRTSAARPALFDRDGRNICGRPTSLVSAADAESGLSAASSAPLSTCTSAPPCDCATSARDVTPNGRRQPLADPYDMVRRSRLGGLRGQRPARAKSHSPGERQDADRRKSILDCDLSAYDLLKRSGGSEAGYASFSDEDEPRPAAAAAAAGDGKRKKKHQRKLTFGYKSRTKSKEAVAGERGSAPSPSTNAAERETTFVDDVSIAGQKIRIFNAFDRTYRGADGAADDWISDPNDELCLQTAQPRRDLVPAVIPAKDDSAKTAAEENSHPPVDALLDRGK